MTDFKRQQERDWVFGRSPEAPWRTGERPPREPPLWIWLIALAPVLAGLVLDWLGLS